MTYQRPGVYVNTSLTPLSTGSTSPGQSTAAFVGVHTQGPTQPTLCKSWNDFLNIFGGFGNATASTSTNYLPFAVWQYFANNGNQCYVVRATGSDAVAATETMNDREAGAGAILPPTGLTATPGGTVTPSNTWEYTVTAVKSPGETNGSVAATAIANQTLTNTNNVVLNWTSVAGATSYNIYRRNLTTGGPLSTPLFLSSVTAPTVTFTDNGTFTPMGAIPLYNTTGTPVPILKLTCVSVGAWGNNLYIDITDSNTGAGRFNLIVKQGGTTDAFIVERFLDMSMNRTDARYAVSMLNSTLLGSKFIRAVDLGTYTTWTAAITPQTQSAVALTSGSDGVQTPSLLTAVQTLTSIQGNLDVNLPGISSTATLNPVIAYANSVPNMFLVVDVPQATLGSDGVTPNESATVNSYESLVVGANAISPLVSTVAIYGPWLQVPDPISSTPGATRTLPPGGAVLGLYSQSDAQFGVQKTPAGTPLPLVRVAGVELAFQNTNLDVLNTNGINVIRNVVNAGFCVMGGRTILTNLPTRYVAIQRTLMNIQFNLNQLTQFAIFDNNNQTLWTRLSSVVTTYLQGLWQANVLQGTTSDQAYFVQCDSGNNTPTTIAAGEVHIQVGLALNTPAEFIVININQMAASATS